jgi:hypothetical protein
MELVRNMAGSRLPTAEQLSDKAKFTDYINSFIDQDFLIDVEPSTNGRFNNLVKAVPYQNAQKGAA